MKMAGLPRPPPALPLEVLEQIIGFHGEAEAVEWRRDLAARTSQRNHPKALLACHMVSKQFRACALRIICRMTFINLHDTPERLKRLLNVISGETHPLSQLVSPAQFIKEVAIFLISYKASCWGDPMHEEVVVKVLKAIAEEVPIENLSFLGNTMPRTPYYWPPFAMGVQQALETIIQLPSVVSLYFRDVRSLSYQLSAMNTRLHTLTILRSYYTQDLESDVQPTLFTATLPKLENLVIHHCSHFPEGLQLPALRTVSAHHCYLSESDASWRIIQRSSQTLTSLTIHDSEVATYSIPNLPTFPKTLHLSSFPQLQYFTYSYHCCYYHEILRTLVDVAAFFSANRRTPNLRMIEFDLYLQGHEEFHDGYLSRLRNHSAWGALDKALASGHFSGIESVYIGIDLSFSEDAAGLLDGTVNLDDTAEALRSNIMHSFSRSKTLAIPIEVGVDVTKS